MSKSVGICKSCCAVTLSSGDHSTVDSCLFVIAAHLSPSGLHGSFLGSTNPSPQLWALILSVLLSLLYWIKQSGTQIRHVIKHFRPFSTIRARPQCLALHALALTPANCHVMWVFTSGLPSSVPGSPSPPDHQFLGSGGCIFICVFLALALAQHIE